MKGYQIVLYLLLFNLTCGFFTAINWPGTADSSFLTGTGNATDYQERFNSTEFMDKTEPEASTAFSFVGHIWSGLSLIWDCISFVFTGFGRLLIAIGDQIGTASAKAAFTSLGVVLQAGLDLVVIFWVYSLLTGRVVEQ